MEKVGNFRLNFTIEKIRNQKIWICHSNPCAISFHLVFKFLKNFKNWPFYRPRTENLGNVTLCTAMIWRVFLNRMPISTHNKIRQKYYCAALEPLLESRGRLLFPCHVIFRDVRTYATLHRNIQVIYFTTICIFDDLKANSTVRSRGTLDHLVKSFSQ